MYLAGCVCRVSLFPVSCCRRKLADLTFYRSLYSRCVLQSCNCFLLGLSLYHLRYGFCYARLEVDRNSQQNEVLRVEKCRRRYGHRDTRSRQCDRGPCSSVRHSPDLERLVLPVAFDCVSQLYRVRSCHSHPKSDSNNNNIPNRRINGNHYDREFCHYLEM